MLADGIPTRFMQPEQPLRHGLSTEAEVPYHGTDQEPDFENSGP